MQQAPPFSNRKEQKLSLLRQGHGLLLSHNNTSPDKFPLAYQILDEQDRIIYINKAWITMTGFTRHEVVGRCFHEFCIPSPAQEQPAVWRNFMLSGHIDNLPLLLRHKNNTPVSVSLGGNIVFSPNRTSFRTHCILHKHNDQTNPFVKADNPHLWRMLLNTAPCILACIAKDERIFFANTRFTELFRCDETIVEGKYLFDILPEKLHKKHAQLLADCFAGNQTNFLDADPFVNMPDKTWLTGSYSPFFRPTGEVDYAIIAATNISEQVQLNQQLTAAEQLGKTGQWEWDRMEKKFVCSDGLKFLFNLPPDTPVDYQELLQCLRPEDLIRFRQMVRRLIDRQTPIEWEFSLPAGAGSAARILQAEFFLSPARDARKQKLTGTLKDITAHKQLEELRRETALRLREFAQTIADISFIIAEDGTVLETFGNQTLPFFGSSINPVGKKLSGLMSKRNADLLLNSIHKALLQKTLQFGEFEIYSSSGKRLFEVRVASMTYKANGVRTAACTAVDITDENRTKRILQLSYERRQGRDLLNNLVERKSVPSQAILDQAWRLRLNLSQPFSCFLAIVKQWQEKPMAHWQEQRAEIQFVIDSLIEIFGTETDAIVWESKEGIGLIYPLRTPLKNIRQQELAVAENLKEIAYTHFSDLSLMIGIAEFHPDSFQQLPVTYYQARDAAYLGQTQASGTEICHYLDLGVFQILPFVTNRDQAETFIRRSLGELIDYDMKKGSQLVDTLEKILRSGNLKLVAEQSFVHHKTIVFRKKRIEKILNVSLDNFETKLTLCTALKLRELLRLNI